MNKNNNKYSQNEVNQLLNKYLKLSNLPEMTIHSFRRTFATLMADQGTDISIIAQLLGHESVRSTQTYINPYYIRNKSLNMPENTEIINHVKKYF